MEIRYKREMNHNYLIISDVEDALEGYQLTMMAKNHIEGLLRFYVRYVDTKKEYYYEISSKQPLGRILESRRITREELSTLLISISMIITRMENYLLEEKQILLEPEYIYIDPSGFCVHLCCVPGISGNFPEAVRQLLQYLLDKVDYQNREDIALIYQLYQESLKENYQMEDLLQLLPHKQEQNFKSHEYDKKSLETPQEEFFYEDEKHKESRRLNQITFWLKDLFTGKSTQKQPIYDYIKEEKVIYHLDEPMGMSDFPGTTTLLSDLDENAKKIIMLKSLSPSCYEDILIEKIPFIIGKNKKGVNYTLEVPEVSRFHVRIENDKGIYLITDLNSTNGTIVNGHLLDANETMKLFHGDTVVIAGIEYCFYEKQ